MHAHVPSLSPMEIVTEHLDELLGLYSRFPLAVYFTHGGV